MMPRELYSHSPHLQINADNKRRKTDGLDSERHGTSEEAQQQATEEGVAPEAGDSTPPMPLDEGGPYLDQEALEFFYEAQSVVDDEEDDSDTEWEDAEEDWQPGYSHVSRDEDGNGKYCFQPSMSKLISKTN